MKLLFSPFRGWFVWVLTSAWPHKSIIFTIVLYSPSNDLVHFSLERGRLNGNMMSWSFLVHFNQENLARTSLELKGMKMERRPHRGVEQERTVVHLLWELLSLVSSGLLSLPFVSFFGPFLCPPSACGCLLLPWLRSIDCSLVPPVLMLGCNDDF